MSGSVSTGYYDWLDVNAPMTPATLDDLVAGVAALRPATVLDVGCGWAEFLLRVVASSPETTGIGVDHDEALIGRAVVNARARSLSDRVTFLDAVDGVEPADLVINCGAEHVFGSLDEALAELHALVKPGGHLFLGTQFWETDPPPDVEKFIGHLPALDGLIDLTTAAGFRPLGLRVATAADWDHFEFGFLRDWEQVVMAPAREVDDDRRQAQEAADGHRAGYLRRRGVLGFAYLTLGRPVHQRGGPLRLSQGPTSLP